MTLTRKQTLRLKRLRTKKNSRKNHSLHVIWSSSAKCWWQRTIIDQTTEDNIVPEILKTKSLKEAKIKNSVSVDEDLLRNRSTVERLTFKPLTHPSLSPTSLCKFISKAAPDSDNKAVMAIYVITVGICQKDKEEEDLGINTKIIPLLWKQSLAQMERQSVTHTLCYVVGLGGSLQDFHPKN